MSRRPYDLIKRCQHCSKWFSDRKPSGDFVDPKWWPFRKACSVKCSRQLVAAATSKPAEQRFWACVTKTADDSCWLWNESKSAHYPRFRVSRDISVKAHRYSFELHYGPIAPGLSIRHKCDQPRCVNAAHLEVGTHADNMRDKVERGRCNVRYRDDGHHGARLTSSQLIELMKLLDSLPRRSSGALAPKKGQLTEIAASFGISYSTLTTYYSRWRKRGTIEKTGHSLP